jgi:hypothetical protein
VKKPRLALLCLIVLACLAGPAASAQAALIHSFDTYLGGGSLSTPEALAVDQSTGDLYVLERGSGCVSRFFGERGGPEALEPHVFPATGTNKLCGLDLRETPANAQVAIDNSETSTQGTIYVNSPLRNGGLGATLAYDSDGNLINELTRNYDIVCGVATDPAGNVYVGERYGGVLTYRHDEPVTEADFEGNLYEGPACLVAHDSLGNRYGSWAPSGPVIKTGAYFRDTGYALTLDPSDDDFYLSEGTKVSGITSDGTEFDRFGEGQLDEARGVAVDPVSKVAYVADTVNGRIAIYTGAAAYRLGVDFTGTGLGAVSADNPPLEECGDEGPCAGYYVASSVVLTATPQTHSIVDGWTGCDHVSSSGDECTVEITSARNVVANFTRIQRNVTASTAGTGTGTISDVNGLHAIQDCGGTGTCSGPYDEGSAIELVATPTGHSTFTGWSGDCTNTSGPCVLVVEGEPSVTAHFTEQHAVRISKGGTGAGSVASAPEGLDCGPVCIGYFTDGQAVTLTATPSGHSTFVGWSGAGCSGAGTCQVQAGGSVQSVTATFAHDSPTASTEPGATYIGQHVATMHGSIDPNGADSRCLVEYGTSGSYGQVAPCVPAAVGAGASPVPAGVNLTGLAPSTTYHFRFSGTNVGGTSYGADQTFRTLDDSCDTNEALCPAPVMPREKAQSRCKKPRVLRKGRCVRKHRYRHRRRASAAKRAGQR